MTVCMFAHRYLTALAGASSESELDIKSFVFPNAACALHSICGQFSFGRWLWALLSVIQLLPQSHLVPLFSKSCSTAILDMRLQKVCISPYHLLQLETCTLGCTANSPSIMSPAERHACQAYSVAASGLSLLLCAVLMGQARIYWDMEHYSKVQAILQQSTDFCSEHEAWKLNSAHTFFMQGGRHMHLFI